MGYWKEQSVELQEYTGQKFNSYGVDYVVVDEPERNSVRCIDLSIGLFVNLPLEEVIACIDGAMLEPSAPIFMQHHL